MLQRCFIHVVIGLLTSQFPAGFPTGQLPGTFGAANFANFRPQYSVPGQAQAQQQSAGQGSYPGARHISKSTSHYPFPRGDLGMIVAEASPDIEVSRVPLFHEGSWRESW
jgi:hypothetical protein